MSRFTINSRFSLYQGRSMAIARLGYEPKRGFKNNDFSDDSDTESGSESDSGSKSKFLPIT